MNRVRVTGMVVLCAAMAAQAAADVTIKQKVTGTGMMASSGDGSQYIKGTRMRMDQTAGGNETSTIIDANTQQMIVLNHKRREAEVHDMTKLVADMSKLPISDVKTSITPTKQSRQIAGYTCTVHDMQVSVPTTMGPEQVTFVLAGPICLVKNGPGAADFAAFFKAASDKGLFFGDPRTAKAQPGQARGIAAMHREMASLGVPLSQEMNIKFEGTGAMAAMMAKMGGNSMTTEAVAISTEAIPDSIFEVPEGYKVIKR
jgi:Domain of unknown function (DUF4412)